MVERENLAASAGERSDSTAESFLERDVVRFEQHLGGDALGAMLVDVKEKMATASRQDREMLQRFLENVEIAAQRYLEAAERHLRQESSPTRFRLEPWEYRELLEATDGRRRQAHKELANSLNILFRNASAVGMGGLEKYAGTFTGDFENDPQYADRVQKLGMVHAWHERKRAQEDDVPKAA